MKVTILLTLCSIVLLCLMILAATVFMPYRGLAKNFPKDVQEALRPRLDVVDIFEPFVTENTARTTGHGTGLGLAVTKRVIGLHGGNITVETAVPGYTIAPPTKPCLQMLDIKKNSQRQKNLKCVSISAFSFLDNFPLCLRLFGNV